jgi:hypothetical protein
MPRISSQISFATSPDVELIELLSDVCDALPALPPITAATEIVDDYRGFLKILNWKIRTANLSAPVGGDGNTPITTEVCKLKILTYLDRSIEVILNQVVRTQTQVDIAFTLFSQMESCRYQFPVSLY